MPLFLIIIGVFCIVASVRGTHKEFFELLRDDFAGQPNFIQWGLAIVFLSFLSLWTPIRPVVKAFIGLIFIVLLISNKGFFSSFMSQVNGSETGNNLDANIIKQAAWWN